MAEISRIESLYGQVALNIVGKALAGQKDAAIASMNADCRPLLAALLKATNDYIAYDQEVAHQRVRPAEDSYGRDHLVMVGQVRQSVEGIATASSQIASGNHDLSSRTEQQASALQQTAASMQQMTGTVQQSADSARAASQLAEAEVEVEVEVEVAGQAGSTMDDVVAQVRRMTDLMGEINASTAEQTTGIVQVNAAVASIDHGTQQNAALVEESAAAAESLKQQATGLLGLVAAFKTADTRRAAFA